MLLFLIAFLAVCLLFFTFQWLNYLSEVKHITLQAQDFVEQKKDFLSYMKKKSKQRIQSFFHEERQNYRRKQKQLSPKIREIKIKIKDLEEKKNNIKFSLKNKNNSLKSRNQSLNDQLKNQKEKTQLIQSECSKKQTNFFNQLLLKTNTSYENEKKLIQKQILIELEKEFKEKLEKKTLLLKEKLPRKIKRLLLQVMQRFDYPAPAEKGLSPISLARAKCKEDFLNKKDLLEIFKIECGVDVLIKKEEQLLYILGLDPVRTKWAHTAMNKIIKKSVIHVDRIKQIVKETQKELIKAIKKDGVRIAKSLNLKNLNPKIIVNMGSLRYRYSFTQNQHFHCEEVGFLCGILMGELGLSVQKGRRGGMLHDIGKSMDHSKEGGHAMIGATFIEEHGEHPEIVHAVRSHHFDTQPEKPLDFLVIAADAISATRLGARKSTSDNYHEKISKLEEICTSYKWVKNMYVLNGGREVRVYVNEKHMSDKDSLDLSKNIARQIEKECSFPGSIKVAVFRENQVSYVAR